MFAAALFVSALGRLEGSLHAPGRDLGITPNTPMPLPNEPSGNGMPNPLNPNIGGEEDINFNKIEDGLIAFIYNAYFPYQRLSNYGASGCGFWNGPSNTDQLWKFVRATEQWAVPGPAGASGTFFIQSHKDKSQRWSNSDKGSYCYSGPLMKDETWAFQPVKAKHYYKWQNSTNFIISDGVGGCKLTTWHETGNEKFLDTYCNDAPGHEAGADLIGSHPLMQQYKIKSPFQIGSASSDGHGATFQIAGDMWNQGPNTVDYKFKYSQGFSESIKESIAKTSTYTVTISITVQAMFMGSGFGNQDTWAITHSTTESYERACESKYLLSNTISYPVLPGQHICLYQAAVPQMKCLVTGTSFSFQSNVYKIAECGDGHKTGMAVQHHELGEILHSSH